MSKILRLLSLSLAFVAHSAVAGGMVENATVVKLWLVRDYPNIVFIQLSASSTGYPPCHVFNPTWQFTLSLNGTNGKELYTMLLTAAASGKPIVAVGTGSCSEHGQIESLNGVQVLG